VREAIGDFPLIAIGGINSENFRDALNAGADSVAIISDLLFDIEKITERMRMLINSCKTS
jgi:thiamine monophosphate synthase